MGYETHDHRMLEKILEDKGCRSLERYFEINRLQNKKSPHCNADLENISVESTANLKEKTK